MTDEDDLRTDTFSSARGWTAVRVTHPRLGIVAERTRSAALKSAVEAQRECIAEIRDALAAGSPAAADGDPDAPVTRAEFEDLVARVRRLEQSG